MRFYRDGDTVRAVQITGPTHNMLGLRLSARAGSLDVEELADSGARQLAADEVTRAVCDGVNQANAALGTHLFARHIQFVPSDSAPAERYRDLASALVRHFVLDMGAADTERVDHVAV